MTKIELRSDGKYDTTCPVCGEAVISTRVYGTTTEGSIKTTPPENHNPVCRGKVLLSKRPRWKNM